MSARLATDRPAPPLPDRPAAELVYLVFVFLPLLFWPRFPATALWTGIAACLLFLPMHFAFRRDMARRRWMIAAVAALGFALIPFNPGGNTFVIYAIAMSAASARSGITAKNSAAVAASSANASTTAARGRSVAADIAIA